MKKFKTVGKIAIVLCVIIVGVFIFANVYSKITTNKVTVQTTNADGVSNGTYIGNYDIAPVKVSLEVTVEEERITDITILEHQNGLGNKAETIIDDVIITQSLEMDAVSGATMSSKAILKAIEGALQSGKGN